MKLTFENFIRCFRKQFIFQVGHGGRRISKYYTNENAEQGLKNDQWGIMVFIHLGIKFGFSDEQMIEELKIKQHLYDFLKEEVWEIVNTDYSDKLLRRKVLTKMGLVENCIYHTYRISLQREFA